MNDIKRGKVKQPRANGRAVSSAALPCPSESAEQRNLFIWADLQKYAHPELQLMYHVPNEGKRTWKNGARLKSEGLRPGVPDIVLPVAKGRYHGLYIELKRRVKSASRVSDAQKWWITELGVQGYFAKVCYGDEDARAVIVCYLLLKEGEKMPDVAGG